MRLPNPFHYVRDWWDRTILEDACECVLTGLEKESPEYAEMFQNWIDNDTIPDDEDLVALARAYERRVRPRPWRSYSRT